MRIFYLNPLYIEICFWAAALLVIAYIEIIHRYGWELVSYRWHRLLSILFSIYVIVLGSMIYVTTETPPGYSPDRLFKHKAFAVFLAILGLIFLIGSLVARKEQVETALGIRRDRSDASDKD